MQLQFRVSGGQSMTANAVEGIMSRAAWMDSVRARFGEVQVSQQLQDDCTYVSISAKTPRRSNVTSPNAALLMVLAALSNETRCTASVCIELVESTSKEHS